MTRQAITHKTLDKHIYSSDMSKHTNSIKSKEKKKILDKSFNCSNSLTECFEIQKIIKNNKPYYSLKSFHQVTLARNLTSNIRLPLKKNKSRNEISRQLLQHLKEGTSYRIYRLDIKSFFESINIDTIRKALTHKNISNQTKILTERIIDDVQNSGGIGLPRGLEFSPSLAELVLQDFDNKVRVQNDVFFYSRYVDDIIIISSGFEDKKKFLRLIKSFLPNELSFNYNKQKIIDVPKRKQIYSEVAVFEYLGYEYKVEDNQLQSKSANQSIFREVRVCLSQSKIKKIKTRIYRTIYCYLKTGDYKLLEDRLAFLTSNRLMKDKKTTKVFATGLYYSNVNIDSSSESLKKIDVYLRRLILKAPMSSRVANSHTLSNSQKRLLLNYSFEKGFLNNNYKRFSPDRLRLIKDAWRY
ncbi:antiviral reverse transcriptase Drt3a [uncultured Psychrobacter sp.]|uniref:antiviral reverse transcriptase Drt3a n=1 Tax=uncultured Psychrobacter sp. TaxID=259303 RepID=UPI002622EAAE|nr:antiviral reverse transcriptase Drt3a [uncultured Psychrobacter sp.]